MVTVFWNLGYHKEFFLGDFWCFKGAGEIKFWKGHKNKQKLLKRSFKAPILIINGGQGTPPPPTHIWMPMIVVCRNEIVPQLPFFTLHSYVSEIYTLSTWRKEKKKWITKRWHNVWNIKIYCITIESNVTLSGFWLQEDKTKLIQVAFE
jgi:hypothetical protein